MAGASERPLHFGSLEEAELYDLWECSSDIPRVPEWDDFPTFRDFALSKGYKAGYKFCRRCADQPLGPHNYRIAVHSGGYTVAEQQTMDLWNRTVNRIRAAYGMPLFKTNQYNNP